MASLMGETAPPVDLMHLMLGVPTGGMFGKRKPGPKRHIERFLQDYAAERAGVRPQANLRAPRRTTSERLGDYVSSGLRRAGVGDRRAEKLGNKIAATIETLTPVGDVTGGIQAGRDLRDGMWLEGAIGALATVLPGAAKGMFGRRGIRAWHGSPHDFDKFDMSKIGTGEGAQAYGHGLYFAEARDVAEEYQRKLAPTRVEFRGEALDEPRKWWAAKDALEAKGDWRIGKALDQLHSWGRQGYDTETALRYLRNEHRNSPEMLEAVDRLANEVAMSKAPGRLYEVNINAKPDEFLDWDAPLKEQPVAGRLDDLRGNRGWQDDYSGRTIYGDIGGMPLPQGSPFVGLEQMRAPQILNERGIPGIRYLDQGSRGAGQGTRNYVVFDPEIIDILNKY